MSLDLDQGLAQAEQSEDGRYRWVLRRRIGPENYKSVLWIMYNSSTANAFDDDPSVRKVRQFSRKFGYSAFTLVNLYAYRTPYPAALREAQRSGVNAEGIGNNDVIRREIAQHKAIVVAWGDSADKERADQVLSWIPSNRCFCLGTTQSGAPRHPLWVKLDATLEGYQRASNSKRGDVGGRAR